MALVPSLIDVGPVVQALALAASTVVLGWIPLAIMAGTSIISALKNRKGKKEKGLEARQEEITKEQLTSGRQARDQFNAMGNNFLAQGRAVRGRYAEPMNYYRAILGGDRSKMLAATGAQRSMMSEGYQGARKNLGRSRLRGTAKQMAEQELNRQEVGQLGTLTQGLQGDAANNMGNLESQIQQYMQGYSGLGLNAKATGYNILAQLLAGAGQNNQGQIASEAENRRNNAQMWSSIGQSAGALAGMYGASRAGGGGGLLPSSNLGTSGGSMGFSGGGFGGFSGNMNSGVTGGYRSYLPGRIPGQA